MELITKEQMDQLLANGAASAASEGGIDHQPVVKLFTPDAGATWLISEVDPYDPDYAYGVADLGVGFVEMGGIYLPEIRELRGRLNLPVERDLGFKARGTVGEYCRIGASLERLDTSAIHAKMGER